MKNFDLFVRIFLPVYGIALIVTTYVYNIILFKKKYGKDPRAKTNEDVIMHFLETSKTIMFLASIFAIIIYSFFPKHYKYIIPVYYLEHIYLQIFGIVLLVIALVVVRIAQIQLKSSYRIGIDRDDKKTKLITTGVYRWSRNPIQFGLFIITFGTFLIIPNIITFAISSLTYYSVSIRSRMEEGHLKELHGDEYLQYKQKTRRWI